MFAHILSAFVRTAWFCICFIRNIKRIIFYRLKKIITAEDGEKLRETISPSTAWQIAGRAGRYGSIYPDGEVTTFSPDDLVQLHELLHSDLPGIEVNI